MTALALLRHAPTAWNEAGRLQGRADPPITAAARAALAGCAVPAPWADGPVLTSPLRRCVETAAALGLDAAPEPALIEMDWGGYEGQSLAALRAAGGAAFAAAEARGLDFTPPGGESPRAVQARLAPLLARLAAARTPCLAITHRGVIRALCARALGWDMTGAPPLRLPRQGGLVVFRLAPDGTPHLAIPDLPLTAR